MGKVLVFATSAEVVRVPSEAVVCVTADGNYSAVRTVDGSEYVLTMQLGQVERRIAELVEGDDGRFVRIGKSLIVNRDYVVQIVPSRQRMVLSDCRTFRYELSASKDALKMLKDYIEKLC